LESSADLSSFSLNDLLSFLFFRARAERHGGMDYEDTREENTVLAEIVRRQGSEWVQAEIDRASRT
jgi:hypothetical protein